MKRPWPAGAETVIFVEGSDEERMVRRLLPQSLGAPVHIQVLQGNDAVNVVRVAGATANASGWPLVTRVGVILDAEEDFAEMWRRVNSIFQAAQLPAPTAAGALEQRGSVRIGGYLLPDNRSLGAMESLLLRTATPDLAACIDAFFTCTPNPGTTTAQQGKARAHALAAATIAGGRPDTLWDRVDVQHQALADLRHFLAALVA